VIKVTLREGQNIEQALKKFKTKIKRAGVMEDHKKSLRFEKRSDRLRRERALRQSRARKAQRISDKY